MVFTQTNAISWQNAASGEIGAWNLKDGAFNGGSIFDNVGANSPWKMKGSADFNSDGKRDIAWQNTQTGEIGLWYTKGSGFDKVTLKDNPGNAWELGGVGDITGDGYNDMFFYNRTTGESGVWAFNGVQRNAAIATSYTTKNGAKLVADIADFPNWQFGGIADFTGDGKADVLWQNTKTNELGFWEMNGDQLIGATTQKYQNIAGWSVRGVSDFTGDGKADILWRENATGAVGFWEMNGKNFVAGKMIANQPSNIQDWLPVASMDTSSPNPLAQYKGQTQNVQLNFSSDAPLSTSEKAGLISLAGIVEQALGGRTNLPAGSTLKITVDKSLIDFVENPVAAPVSA